MTNIVKADFQQVDLFGGDRERKINVIMQDKSSTDHCINIRRGS